MDSDKLQVQGVSLDLFQTWGQTLYEEFECKVEDYDWVRVRIEMVVLREPMFCVYLITEECFVDGHAYINRYAAEHGTVLQRFEMVRSGAERFANWRQYWLGSKRSA